MASDALDSLVLTVRRVNSLAIVATLAQNMRPQPLIRDTTQDDIPTTIRPLAVTLLSRADVRPWHFLEARFAKEALDITVGCSELAKFAPRDHQCVSDLQSSRCGLKQFSVTARFKRIEIASKGRSGLKIAHAIGFYPQGQKISLGWVCSGEDDYEGFTMIFEFSRTTPENTSGSCSSLNNRIRLKIDQGILHTHGTDRRFGPRGLYAISSRYRRAVLLFMNRGQNAL